MKFWGPWKCSKSMSLASLVNSRIMEVYLIWGFREEFHDQASAHGHSCRVLR